MFTLPQRFQPSSWLGAPWWELIPLHRCNIKLDSGCDVAATADRRCVAVQYPGLAPEAAPQLLAFEKSIIELQMQLEGTSFQTPHFTSHLPWFLG